jgi:hypothetical protein
MTNCSNVHANLSRADMLVTVDASYIIHYINHDSWAINTRIKHVRCFSCGTRKSRIGEDLLMPDSDVERAISQSMLGHLRDSDETAICYQVAIGILLQQ